MTAKDKFECFRRTKAYDILVAAPLIAWFGRGAWHDAQNIAVHLQLIQAGTETAVGWLQMVAMVASAFFCALLVFLLLTRTLPRARAMNILPRLMAVIGTFLGTAFLYLTPVALPLWGQILAVVLIFVAAVLGVIVIVWLGRSFAIMPEARVLVTGGPYALVRHPLYVVETVGMSAMLLQFLSWLGAGLFLAYVAAQIARALFEEQVLGATFPEYAAYQERTARFIPYIY